MANLLEQVAQLPHFEYIPPRQKKARPIERVDWTDRNYRDACPQCGASKCVNSHLCYQCAFSRCRAAIDPQIYYVEGDPCRKVPLSRGLYAIVDAEDYEWVMQWRWTAPRRVGKKKSYVVTSHCLDPEQRPLQYVTLNLQHLVTQCERGFLLDHANRDTLDNRKHNIRPSTLEGNAQNKDRFSTNKSGYKGVWKCTHSDTYQTCINVNGQKINIGNFYDPREAAFERDVYTFIFHGEFGVLNFPELIDEIRQRAQSDRPKILSKLRNHDDLQ